MKKKHIIKTLLFILLTATFMLINCTLNGENSVDDIWNYHMIIKISQGLIPFNEIAMIIPPLFHYIGLLFFKIFGTSFFTFYFFGALTGSIVVYITIDILNDICKNKLLKTTLGILAVLSFFIVISANYNILALLFTLCIIKNEIVKIRQNGKNDKKHNIINGIFFSLLLITKHSYAFILGSFYIFYIIALSMMKTDNKISKKTISFAFSNISSLLIGAIPILRIIYNLPYHK